MEKHGKKSCRGKLVKKIESWKLKIFPKSHAIYPLRITNQAREVAIIPYLHIDNGPGKNLVPPRGTKAHMFFLLGICM